MANIDAKFGMSDKEHERHANVDLIAAGIIYFAFSLFYLSHQPNTAAQELNFPTERYMISHK